jgi:hypothetical protein
MKMHLALTVGAALLVAAAARAADYVPIDTETLNGWCNSYEDGTSGGEARCIGYINSVADTLARGIPINDHRACIPKDVPMAYLRVLAITALEARSEDGNTRARDRVARVLAEAFPC